MTVHWKMRKYKAQPEKIVPPKDAYEIRSKTLTIKKANRYMRVYRCFGEFIFALMLIIGEKQESIN